MRGYNDVGETGNDERSSVWLVLREFGNWYKYSHQKSKQGIVIVFVLKMDRVSHQD